RSPRSLTTLRWATGSTRYSPVGAQQSTAVSQYPLASDIGQIPLATRSDSAGLARQFRISGQHSNTLQQQISGHQEDRAERDNKPCRQMYYRCTMVTGVSSVPR